MDFSNATEAARVRLAVILGAAVLGLSGVPQAAGATLIDRDGTKATYDINDFGANPAATGAVNRAAILAALNTAKLNGGGRIIGAPGTYLITGHATQSLPVPVSGANFATANRNIDAHFYLLEPENLDIDLPGVTLQSSKTDAGQMFLLNGPRNVRINIGRLVSPLTIVAGRVSVAGVEGIGITTTTRDGWNVSIPSLHLDHIYTGIYVFGDPAGPFRMRGLQLGAIYHESGEYGLALHDNGDDVTIGSLVTNGVGRPFFCYGVDGVRGQVVNRAQLGGLQALLKAYDRDLTNVDLDYRIVTGNNSVPGLSFQSQHHVATQPTPARLRNITVRYDDRGSIGGGLGIEFDYLQDSTRTSTCSTAIFDNLTLSGILEHASLVSTVTQTSSPLPVLDATGLLLAGAPSTAIYPSGGWRQVISSASRQGPSVARPR